MRKYLFFLALGLAFALSAQQPANYYQNAQGLSGTALRSALHNIIAGHTALPYTSSGLDTWDVLKKSDYDSTNTANVIMVYTGGSRNGAQEFNNGNGWSREHVWPASLLWGSGTSTGVGTDLHNLKPSVPAVNSSRSNKLYDNGGNPVSVGAGPVANTFATTTTWEPRPEMKGDLARIIFYMALRYEGTNGEPDLSLVDTNLATTGEFGVLSTLLSWHLQDPVDNFERRRNDSIYKYQGNRNPFIDNPQYVQAIWAGGSGPSVAGGSVNFDDPAQWSAGSGALSSYQNDHEYRANHWVFSGGPALRDGTANQDGVASALGSYSWRLQDNASVSWTATYDQSLTSGQRFTALGFSARRWSASPAPAFQVEYSFDGGISWTVATAIGSNGLLNNNALSNSSQWQSFSQPLSSPAGLSAQQVKLRVQAQGTTGRLFIDDFSFAIGKDEPSNHVLNFSGTALSASQINLAWADNHGAVAADGFLVLGKTGSGSFANLADGQPVSPDSDWSDGNFAVSLSAGVQSLSLTGLDPATTYDFVIHPFSNSGAAIDYKTSPAPPSLSASTPAAAVQATIDFDDANLWTAGSGGITSYQSDHEYRDRNWIFSGGAALRNTTSAQDGFPGALGTYAWRLRNEASVVWTAVYNAAIGSAEQISSFGFSVRRWDASPSPNFQVDYSVDGGSSWQRATAFATNGTIDNAGLNNSSQWISFSQSLRSPAGLAAGQFRVRVAAQGSTERIMIDDFSFSIAPVIYRYDGLGWSPSSPVGRSLSAFDAEILAGTAEIDSSTELGQLSIAAGAMLIVKSGHSLVLSAGLDNQGGMRVENNAALVQTSTADLNSGSGTYEVQREIDALDHRRFNYWSSPVAGASFGSVFGPQSSSPTNPADWYRWVEASQQWSATNSLTADSSLEAGRGYLATPTPQPNPNQGPIVETRTFSGSAVHNGPLSHSYQVSADADNNRFVLLGNPYPSAVSLSDFIDRNADLRGTLHFWDDRGAFGNRGYAAWNQTGATRAQGGPQARVPDAYLQSGQGFFAHAMQRNIQVHWDNSLRAVGNNRQFFKTDPQARLWLSLQNDSSGFQEILVSLDDSSLVGYEAKKDGIIFKGHSQLAFYTRLDSLDLVIQALPAPPAGGYHLLPLGLEARVAGDYRIGIEARSAWDSAVGVYLVDSLSGQVSDLSQAPHRFSLSQAADLRQRFYLRLGTAPAGLGQPEYRLLTWRFVRQQQSLLVWAPAGQKAPAQLQLRGLDGRVHWRATLAPGAQGEHFALPALASGLYLLQLEGAAGIHKLYWP